jgi:dTDP-4-amino-4,6-dideoxygalactose transaminase
VKLKHLADWNSGRRAAAARYAELFKQVPSVTVPYEPDNSRAALYRRLLQGVPGVTLPVEAPDRKHVYHLFVIRVADRKGLMDHFAANGIQCGIHYPIPIHLQEAYQSLGLKAGSFPFCEQSAGEIVSLPMFAELTDEQVAFVCEQIKAFLVK